MKVLRHPKKLILLAGSKGCFKWIPDEPYLRLLFRAEVGQKLNLNNPKSYNEKLQWIKLYDHNPVYTVMADKYLVRDFVRRRIDEDILIPFCGVWDKPEDIDFDSLPEQFVLKCNHDSGSIIKCTDKASFDRQKAVKKLRKRLKRDYYKVTREWPYKNIRRRIIAEVYLEDSKCRELPDYKFYTFNGEVKMIMVTTGRAAGDTRAEYYDENFNPLNIQWGYERPDNPLPKPALFEKMKQYARILSEDTPELRVDFYICNGRIYFGELTFFDGGGLMPVDPVELDYKLGSWIDIPALKEKIAQRKQLTEQSEFTE